VGQIAGQIRGAKGRSKRPPLRGDTETDATECCNVKDAPTSGTAATTGKGAKLTPKNATGLGEDAPHAKCVRGNTAAAAACCHQLVSCRAAHRRLKSREKTV
jgi:hypothetical protein